MRPISFDIEDRMKTIGWYQIVGGVLGISLTIKYLIYITSLSGLGFLFYVVAFSLFSFSIYSGNLLRKANLKGLKFSIWNQALQALQFSLSGLSYGYCSGIFLRVGFEWTDNFKPDGGLGLSAWHFRYSEISTNQLEIFVNLIPFLIIYWLLKLENQIESRKELIENSTKLSEVYKSKEQLSSLE